MKSENTILLSTIQAEINNEFGAGFCCNHLYSIENAYKIYKTMITYEKKIMTCNELDRNATKKTYEILKKNFNKFFDDIKKCAQIWHETARKKRK